MKSWFKKISLLVILGTSLSILVGCNGNHREDDFFSSSELSYFSLKGLPTPEYDGSYLTLYSNSLEGVFNISDSSFTSYASDILNYLKESGLKYGGLIYPTRDSFAGLFTSYDYYTYDNVNLYRSSSTYYTFIFSPLNDDTKCALILEKTNSTINGKDYDSKISIATSSLARNYKTNSDYNEIALMDSNVLRYSELYTFHEDFNEIQRKELLYVYFSMYTFTSYLDLEITASYLGVDSTLTIHQEQYESNGYKIEAYFYFEITKTYEKEDLVIKSYKVGEGSSILKEISQD